MELSRVLIVENDADLRVVVKGILETAGIETDAVSSPSEALNALMQASFDLMLLSLLPGKDSGLDILQELHDSGSSLPVVVTASSDAMALVGEAMKLHAFDYLLKPYDRVRILDVVQRGIRAAQASAEPGGQSTTGKAISLISQSPAMIEIFKTIARVAGSESSVLITGEAGTGKELIAKAVHEQSARAANPFSVVHCDAMESDVLEAELFGSSGVDGEVRKGLLELTSGGTLYLDQVAETSSAFQAKLLWVLQQRSFRRSGTLQETKVNVRVLASSASSPAQLASSSFRKDLLYALSVIHIAVPPLKERPEDIALLADYFMNRWNRRLGKSVTISSETMEKLKLYSWPGNVSELENVMERAVTMNVSGELLPEELLPPAAVKNHISSEADGKGSVMRTSDYEKDFFDQVNDIVYVRDFDGVIQQINVAWERFFGHSRSEVVGKTLHELLRDPDLESNLRSTNEKLIRTGSDRSILSIRDAKGYIRVLEADVSLVRNASGDPIAARGIMRDISESKQMEEQLRQRTRELEEANEKLQELDRIKADFAAVLVHDLKTPATTVILALEYLKDRYGNQADVGSLISAGLESGRSLVHMIEDMLEIFRYDHSEMELNRVLVRADDLLEEPVADVIEEAATRGIHLSSRLYPGIPELYVDPGKIRRAVVNLLRNAINNTPDRGKVHLETAFTTGLSGNDDDSVRISVSDSGPGIPVKDLAYVFDPYWRKASGETGFGLSLAAVKRIVSAHGGEVSVRSSIGFGTEFWMTIPVQKAGSSDS